MNVSLVFKESDRCHNHHFRRRWPSGGCGDRPRRAARSASRRGRRIVPWTGAGSSGSTGAARSPTWSRAAPTARWPCTSCCRKTRARTPIPPLPASGTCSASRPGRTSQPAGSPWSAWVPRWQRMPCWSATGEPCVLVITAGFGDALRIAYQDRPKIFDREIVRPEMLYSRVIEATERVTAGGEVLVPLDDDRGGPRPARRLRRGVPLGRGRLPARLPVPGARGADRRDRPRDRASPRCRCRTRPAR